MTDSNVKCMTSLPTGDQHLTLVIPSNLSFTPLDLPSLRPFSLSLSLIKCINLSKLSPSLDLSDL